MAIRRLWLCCAAALAMLAASAQQPQQPAAPDGNPFAAQPGEPMLALSFKDAAVADVATKMGELLETIVLVDPKVEGTVTVTRELPKRLALQAVAGQLQATPRRIIILCTKEQARGSEKPKTEAKVKMSLEKDTKLSTIALVLAAATKENIRCTPEAAGLLAAFKSEEELPLVDVLDKVAEKAGAAWVYGYILQPVDPQTMLNGLQMFQNLPAEQRNRLMEQGIDRAFAEFRNTPPAERAAAVNRFVGFIDRLSQTIARADPETQAKIKAAIKPMVEMGVRKFVMLDANEQAQMMPAIRSLDKLR